MDMTGDTRADGGEVLLLKVVVASSGEAEL